jgi:hypothetical protein
MNLSVIPHQIDLNNSEQYILDKIKRLYSETDREVTLYLEPKIRNLNPDFILIDPNFGIAIIEVKAWSDNYVVEMNNREVSTSDGRKYENPSLKGRRYFNTLKSIFNFDTSLLNDEAEFKYNIVSNIFFTELNESLEFAGFLNHFPTKTFYKNELRKITIEDIFNKKSSQILKDDLPSIRSLIFPEIKISSELKEKQELEDINEYRTKALDTNQEAFIKRDISGHYHVSGVPGSGKTVMLVSRALYLLKENPDSHIGIITYNKSLATNIENRLKNLEEDLEFANIKISNIEVRTFHNLALYFSNTRVPQYANDEFWSVTLPELALKRVSPLYDSILIDEYQDFYKSWIEICIKATKNSPENKRSIFFAGDRLQSIYNPNEINWKQDFNLNMVGRSMLLKKSYRTSKTHIHTALKILENDPILKKEVLKFYEGSGNIETFNEVENSLEFVQGYYSNVVQKIKDLIDSGYKISDFLILVPNWNTANKIKSYFPSNIQNEIITSKDIVSNKMVITTYLSSKGLENRVGVIFHFDYISDRKLAYVSFTRASEKLIVHYSDSKNPLIKEILNFENF